MATEIEKLTEAKLEGTGVFDRMMCAIDEHLKREHQANRIRGPEYANVYASALASTMGQAVQFLQTQAQIELLEQQTAKAAVDVEVSECQKLKIEAETANLAKLREKIDTEIALLTNR